MSARKEGIGNDTVRLALEALATGPLADWLSPRRWFGAKGRAIESIVIADALTLEEGPPVLVLALCDVRSEGTSEPARYAVLLGLQIGCERQGEIGTVDLQGGLRVSADDASAMEGSARALVALMAAKARRRTDGGGLVEGIRREAMDGALAGVSLDALPVHVLGVEQSNTSYVLGDRLIAKLYRRLRAGVQPDIEMLEFLERAGFANAPRVAGALYYRPREVGCVDTALAVAHRFIANRGDAWSVTRASLRAALEGRGDLDACAAPMKRLGEVTGAMHAALASDPRTPAFAPEPMGPIERARTADALDAWLARAAEAIAPLRTGSMGDDARRGAERILSGRAEITAAARAALAAVPEELVKIRVHGDYHLGQVLVAGDDFVVIDFEGEPLRSLEERRAKHCALRDVAGMLRSFHYAAHASAKELGGTATTGAEHWESLAREFFVSGYLPRAWAAPLPIVPQGPDTLARLLAVFELEKALYEVVYETSHRPDWVEIPLAGVLRPLAELGL